SLPVHNDMRQGLQRGAVRLAVERRAGLRRVPQRKLARFVQRARGGDAVEGVGNVLTCERPGNGIVAARGEDEWKRRRAVAQIDALHLPRRVEVAAAVEDVVCDLESDAEREPEASETRAVRAASEQAGSLEELPGLQGAAREVLVHRGLGPEGLAPLHRLAAREGERRIGEDRHRLCVTGLRELRESAREEVVARRPGRCLAVLGPDRRAPAAQVGAVEKVVVDERRHVHELDRRSTGDGALALPLLRRGREEDEERPEPLPARGERVRADIPEAPGKHGDRALQPVLEQVEVAVEAGSLSDGRQRVHRFVPTWRATIPPPISFHPTPSKPALPNAAARSEGPGNRRTLAGRYV